MNLEYFSLEESFVAILILTNICALRFEMFRQDVVKIQFRNRVQPPETVLNDRYR